MKKARNIIARISRSKYQEVFKDEFLLSESTVEYEIEYHIDGYLYSIGKEEYFLRRNITTWLFPIEKLNLHCKAIDIDVMDIFETPLQGGFYES